MDAPLTFVIVLSWNNLGDILDCLNSSRSMNYTNYRVVVVDNGSVDATVESVAREFPAAHVIQNGYNLGYAEGNNVGIRFAVQNGAEYIFLLNSDATVESDSLTRLIESAQGDMQIGILCPTITSNFDRTRSYVGAKINLDTGVGVEIERSPEKLPEVLDTDYAPGCALLIKSEVVQEIGLFDPAFFAYYEDVDWSIRCKKAGYRIVAVPGARVYHKGTADQHVRKPPVSTFYYWRNRVLFMRRHARLRQWAPFLKHYIRKSLERYQSFAQAGDQQSAEAVLDGCWAGFLGRYGSERVQAPVRFKRFVQRRLGFALWLTGWLYFWDYHKLKRQGMKELRPSI